MRRYRYLLRRWSFQVHNLPLAWQAFRKYSGAQEGMRNRIGYAVWVARCTCHCEPHGDLYCPYVYASVKRAVINADKRGYDVYSTTGPYA